MKSQPEFDVAVIGGGPAGCAAAIALRKYAGLRTVLLEASKYDNRWPGQTVSPGIVPLLDYLGVHRALDNSSHLVSYGVDALWGHAGIASHDSIFAPGGQGWFMDRAKFDCALAKFANQLGTDVMTEARVVSSSPTEYGWNLKTLCKEKRSRTILARFVIDASGCDSSFARGRGVSRRIDDPLLAAALVFQHPSGEFPAQRLRLEATKDGWWYTSPLPESRQLLVFMTDASNMRTGHLADTARFIDKANQTLFVRESLAQGKPIERVSIRPAYTSILNSIGGEHWVAVGDAAASFDPLSSMGIGHALLGGIQGARVVAALITGKDRALEDYSRAVHANYVQYQHIQESFYLREKRWCGDRFWVSRQVRAASWGDGAPQEPAVAAKPSCSG